MPFSFSSIQLWEVDKMGYLFDQNYAQYPPRSASAMQAERSQQRCSAKALGLSISGRHGAVGFNVTYLGNCVCCQLRCLAFPRRGNIFRFSCHRCHAAFSVDAASGLVIESKFDQLRSSFMHGLSPSVKTDTIREILLLSNGIISTYGDSMSYAIPYIFSIYPSVEVLAARLPGHWTVPAIPGPIMALEAGTLPQSPTGFRILGMNGATGWLGKPATCWLSTTSSGSRYLKSRMTASKDFQTCMDALRRDEFGINFVKWLP